MSTNDILLGRGRFCYSNPGNVAFRNMIREHVGNYTFNANRSQKGGIIHSLIIKAKDQGRLFLVRSLQDGMWCEAHSKLVRSKVSHALRDARNPTTQQLSLKKSMSMSDSVNFKVKQNTKSFSKEATTSLTNESITSYDWSQSKYLPSRSCKIEFPLKIQITTLGGLKNEFGDSVDQQGVRPLEDTYQEYEQVSMSKKEIETKVNVATQNYTQHQSFQRYVFHISYFSM
jgi:hypothetical protein